MIEILLKDPLIMLFAVLGFTSFILILLLINYYQKAKEQEAISEVEQTNSEKTEKLSIKNEKDRKDENVINTDISKISGNFEEKIEEVFSQISSLNSKVNELLEKVSSLSEVASKSSGLSEVQQEKLLSVLQQIQNVMTTSSNSNQAEINLIYEVNNKLDNVIRVLSTIIQK